MDAEAVALGRDLDVTPYEARLTLAQGTPTILCTTADEARALELVARVRGRGHVAILVNAAAVVPAHAMVPMRHFRLEGTSIRVDDRPSQALPYEEIGALIAAVHSLHTTTESETHDRKLSLGRAVLTGGLVMTKTVSRETRTETSEREPVLYVFPRSGAVPWLLRERGTLWAGHGAAVSPTSTANFKLTVQKLRERSPGAMYDDRLVSRRGAAERIASAGMGGGSTTWSSGAAIDLLAHVLALSQGVR